MKTEQISGRKEMLNIQEKEVDDDEADKVKLPK